MKKISLRWRMALMSLIIVIITCVSMKIAICSSGTAQITELGDYVLDFTAGYSKKKFQIHQSTSDSSRNSLQKSLPWSDRISACTTG